MVAQGIADLVSAGLQLHKEHFYVSVQGLDLLLLKLGVYHQHFFFASLYLVEDGQNHKSCQASDSYGHYGEDEDQRRVIIRLEDGISDVVLGHIQQIVPKGPMAILQQLVEVDGCLAYLLSLVQT